MIVDGMINIDKLIVTMLKSAETKTKEILSHVKSLNFYDLHVLGQQKSNETFSKIFLILFIQKLSIIYQVCIHL